MSCVGEPQKATFMWPVSRVNAILTWHKCSCMKPIALPLSWTALLVGIYPVPASLEWQSLHGAPGDHPSSAAGVSGGPRSSESRPDTSKVHMGVFQQLTRKQTIITNTACSPAIQNMSLVLDRITLGFFKQELIFPIMFSPTD